VGKRPGNSKKFLSKLYDIQKGLLQVMRESYSKSESVVITSMTKTLTVGVIHELPLPQIK